MNLEKEIESTLLKYVSTKTHTSTELENNNISFFKAWFESVEYLKENPDKYGFFGIEEDYLDRKVPWALLKGEGLDTIVLIHHTDTVDTDDYGKYKELAYAPKKLKEKYNIDNIALDEDTKRDLEGEDWIFGRGIADMKGGGSIHLSLFKKYSLDKNFKGNLIILALPDEENLSAGMRGATRLLKEIKDKYNLNYILMLNAEPHERDDENIPSIYDGSIGKIMPVVYVRGKLAHVGQIFNGLNPINLLSEIIRRTELKQDFIEKRGNTVTPPPTWLYMKDNKNVYDVSLPISAMGYMSVLTLRRGPKEIFDDLKKISENAFKEVIYTMNKSYERYNKLQDKEKNSLELEPKVMFFSELHERALEDSGEIFKKEIENLNMQIKAKFHKNKITIVQGVNLIIEKTLEFINDRSPIVVIALAPPYYPHVHNMDLKETKNIDELIKDIIEFSKENWNQEYNIKNYYTGITDLSYVMSTLDGDNIDYIENNMLMWKNIYDIDFESIKEISTPVLNIGPWGKDFHKYTERVYREDLLHKTPRIIELAINKILKN